MKSVLLWSDGRREPTECGGGHSVIYMHNVAGRETEITFRASEVEPGDVVVYREHSSRDVAAECRESHARSQLETFRRLGITPPAPLAGGRYRLPGETDDEARRRINIMHGREPENDGGR